MKRSRYWTLAVSVAALAAAAGYGFHLWRLGAGADAGPQPAAQAIFAARLPDLQGTTQGLERWRGRVLVVNFWATWCAPCREEIPLFVKMQARYGERGLQFVGIAIDRPEPVAAFAREFGINYPLLLGGVETMELMRRSGNRAGVLPYTVVIDRRGGVARRELGGIKEPRLESIIHALL